MKAVESLAAAQGRAISIRKASGAADEAPLCFDGNYPPCARTTIRLGGHRPFFVSARTWATFEACSSRFCFNLHLRHAGQGTSLRTPGGRRICLGFGRQASASQQGHGAWDGWHRCLRHRQCVCQEDENRSRQARTGHARERHRPAGICSPRKRMRVSSRGNVN